MSYLDFLKALLALGPKLPEAFARVQKIVAEVMELVALVRGPSPEDGGLETLDVVGPDVLAVEGEVMSALHQTPGAEALGDGTLLRRLYSFAKAHPELLTLLVSLLKG